MHNTSHLMVYRNVGWLVGFYDTAALYGPYLAGKWEVNVRVSECAVLVELYYKLCTLEQ